MGRMPALLDRNPEHQKIERIRITLDLPISPPSPLSEDSIVLIKSAGVLDQDQLFISNETSAMKKEIPKYHPKISAKAEVAA